MNPERWQQIDKLLEHALELPPDERPAFLDTACAGDASLRQELDLLLKHDERTTDFVGAPPPETIAALIADTANTNAPEPGRVIGDYKIIQAIGAGGMGDVFLAIDGRLGRKVALKVLRSDLICNRDRLRRFKQEARAASALNHPNIVTIYEIGQSADGGAGPIHFIATELVEGETIRRRLSSSGLSIAEAVDVALQVCSALAAAHKVGIVHRDIKPENIMIRDDGYVKLLDFGLAKLTERPEPSDSDGRQVSVVNTDTGVVIGTPSYMSPEQVRGLHVDSRTDIFSLGVTLYEMVTGRPPFEAETVGDLVVAVLQKEPTPVRTLLPNAPARLSDVIERTLCKKQEERYQTITDLAADLREVAQESDLRSPVHAPLAQVTNRARPGGSATGDVGDRPTLDADPGRSTVIADRDEVTAQHARYATAAELAPKRSKARLLPRAVNMRLAIAVAVLALAASIAVVIHYTWGKPGITSLAILPFENASADPGIDYLSDGVPESIIDSLSPIPNLKVMSFGSVMPYKNRRPTPAEVAHDLGVRAVLTGRIDRRGDSLRITAELVDARDNRSLWGAQYDRKPTDIAGIQQEIAGEISEGLRLRLSADQRKQLTRRYTENTEAYQLYLQGRYFWAKRNAPAIQQAIKCFNQAIDKDPNYALAWAGLADCYATPSAELQPGDGMPKAREAAGHALAIDDSLAEAHASLAFVRYRYDWDWNGAENEFRRSISLNPNYAAAHQWYGEYLTDLGRFDEALAELNRAAALDPLSLIIKVDTATLYYYWQKYDRAIEQCKKALEMDDRFRLAHICLGRIYEQQHMDKESVDESLKARSLHGDSPETLSSLRSAFEARGLQGYFERAAELAREESTKGPIGEFSVAGVYAMLGRKDEAFDALRLAVQQKDATLVTLKVDPRLYSLRSDARFSDLLKQMHFPQ